VIARTYRVQVTGSTVEADEAAVVKVKRRRS
jgi:hypothetical protein